MNAKFGRLAVLSVGPNRTLRCICECGEIAYPTLHDLKSGKSKSCGCLKLEVLRAIKHTTTHGLSKTPEHKAWSSMFDRCENPKCKAYKDYGGRGITICERWRVFTNFLEDMGPRPPGTSLDREKNDLGYCEENCRWATRVEQSNNRRSTVMLTLGDETLSLAQWHQKLNLPKSTIQRRLARGWSLERALTETTQGPRK